MHQFADDPILTAGFEYWSNLLKEADVPDRGDVDPIDMPRHILSNIALLELVDDGADAVVRLAGREFDENFGVSLKGKTMSELTEEDYRDYMLGHLRKLVDERKAIFSESAFRWDRGGQLRTRRIMMPLSNGDPGVVAMALVVQTWPHEQMCGLTFCDVITDATAIENSSPNPLNPNDN